MTDIATLQTDLMGAIDSADTLDSLEAVRIAALGKQGSVSALLKTMGSMSPEERQTQGPIINWQDERCNEPVEDFDGRTTIEEMNRRMGKDDSTTSASTQWRAVFSAPRCFTPWKSCRNFFAA